MRDILSRPPELPKELRQQDRRDLDACVFELIGVTDPKQREQLLNALYQETTNYYRYQRTQDIQAMENRSGKKAHRTRATDLAGSIWHSLQADQTGPTITEWIKALALPVETVQIPEGKPHPLGASDMFHPAAVIFKGDKDTHQVDYADPEQAALAAELAAVGVRGSVEIPKSPADSKRCLKDLHARFAAAHDRFSEAAAQRTGQPFPPGKDRHPPHALVCPWPQPLTPYRPARITSPVPHRKSFPGCTSEREKPPPGRPISCFVSPPAPAA